MDIKTNTYAKNININNVKNNTARRRVAFCGDVSDTIELSTSEKHLKKPKINPMIANFIYKFKTKLENVEYKEVRASHILVKTEEEAKDILNKINNGASFEEMAKKYSTCPSKKEGGDLDYFSKGMMVSEFEKVAFEIDKDKISEPVKTKFGWHLIKVTDKKA